MSSSPLAFLELTDVQGQQLLVAVAEISSVSEAGRVHHFAGGERRFASIIITRNGKHHEVRDEFATIQDRLRDVLRG